MKTYTKIPVEIPVVVEGEEPVVILDEVIEIEVSESVSVKRTISIESLRAEYNQIQNSINEDEKRKLEIKAEIKKIKTDLTLDVVEIV